MAVAGTGFALYLIYLLRGVVELIVLGVFVALWLGPFVEFLTRRRTPRVLAILMTYLALFGSLVFLGLVVVPPITDQINKGVRQLPAGISKLRGNATFRKYDNKYKITLKLESEARKLPSRLASIAKELSAVTVGAFSALTKLVTVLALGFFLLRDGPKLANRLYRIRGPDQEERLRRLGTDIYRSVSGYVAGNIGISVIAGLVAYVALTTMGIAFAAPLAVIVGVFDLLPLVGATIAAIIVGVVTLFYSFPTDTIIWAIVVIVYQQIENNVLSPIVYRRTVQVPGMLVLVSVLVGATLRGVIGALLAIPVAAAIQIVVRDVWQQRHEVSETPASPSSHCLPGACGRDVTG
jgi:predicted PurR-regulated permease PerM